MKLDITKSSGLVNLPHDPYWDGPITRREVQMAVNDLCINEAELMARSDTAHIVLNFLCERIGTTRGEIDAYIEKKKAEIAALKEAQAQESANGPNK